MLGGPPSLPVLEPVGAVTTEIVSSSPLGGSFEAYTLFLLAIEAARRSIEVTNPYFVPDARMSATILGAVRRGVRVACSCRPSSTTRGSGKPAGGSSVRHLL